MAILCGPENPTCPNPVINNEGFKLTTSVCNQSLTDPSNNPTIVWDSKAGLRPHGFVVEFRIPLTSINTLDTSWFSKPDRFPGEQAAFGTWQEAMRKGMANAAAIQVDDVILLAAGENHAVTKSIAALRTHQARFEQPFQQ